MLGFVGGKAFFAGQWGAKQPGSVRFAPYGGRL